MRISQGLGGMASICEALNGTPLAIFARGDSTYARFNRGGDVLRTALRTACGQLDEIVPYTRADAKNQEATIFHSWLENVVLAVQAQMLMLAISYVNDSNLMCKCLQSHLQVIAISHVNACNLTCT